MNVEGYTIPDYQVSQEQSQSQDSQLPELNIQTQTQTQTQENTQPATSVNMESDTSKTTLDVIDDYLYYIQHTDYNTLNLMTEPLHKEP